MYETISETLTAYDDMLNEIYGSPLEDMGIGSQASDILRELDPLAYKCGWHDWCDSEGIDTDELEDDTY